MIATFTKHEDPGHGWLEVTETDLKDVGLKISDISGFSYRKGRRLFLEEDCDASLFFTAFKNKHGEYPRYVIEHTNGDFPVEMDLDYLHE